MKKVLIILMLLFLPITTYASCSSCPPVGTFIVVINANAKNFKSLEQEKQKENLAKCLKNKGGNACYKKYNRK